MKTFIKCEMCKAEVPVEKCVFAVHKKVVGGKEHVFCCARCAENYEKNKT